MYDISGAGPGTQAKAASKKEKENEKEKEKGKEKEKKPVTGAAAKRLEALKKTMPDIMDVAIDPSDLETLDDIAIKELYDAKLAESRKGRGLTDVDQMMASHLGGDKKRKGDGKAAGKKEKKFKF